MRSPARLWRVGDVAADRPEVSQNQQAQGRDENARHGSQTDKAMNDVCDLCARLSFTRPRLTFVSRPLQPVFRGEKVSVHGVK